MSKLNQKNTRRPIGREGASYNGNMQEVKTHAQQLFEIITLTLYGNGDKYYESETTIVKRLCEALTHCVKANDLDFVANAIVHARTAMHIRTMPLMLTVMFAKELRAQKKSYANMRTVVRDVIQRADQITDMLAFSLTEFGEKKAIPTALKRGIADAFNKFDEYQFAKYNRDNAVKFTDVMRIVHPEPKTLEQGIIFDKIMNSARPDNQVTAAGQLATPYTWETQLSEAGKSGKDKAEVWTQLVESGKLGYMALLRNIRNIAEAGVSTAVMKKVCDRIADPKEVARSKQLPFRFTTAYNIAQELNHNGLIKAVSRALDASVSNMPNIGDNVWIMYDSSGSMRGAGMNPRDRGNYYGYGRTAKTFNGDAFDNACLFAAVLAKASADSMNVAVTHFATGAEMCGFNSDDSVMSIYDSFKKKNKGYGTDLGAALKLKPKLGFEPDAVFVISDMQVNRLDKSQLPSAMKGVSTKIALNLGQYETTPVGELSGWYQLAGWSSSLFDFIPAMKERVTVTKALSVPYLGVETIKSQHNLG